MTSHYHYDLNGNLIAETSNTAVTRAVYVYADTTPIAQIRRSGSTDTLSYLHTDQLDTPRLATSTSQAVVWRWEGRAFGDTAPTGSVMINLRFPGQYFDQETGFIYNHHRYYWAQVGRYIQSDPIGLGGGLNTYLYTYANPLRFADPTGLRGPGVAPGVAPSTSGRTLGPPVGGSYNLIFPPMGSDPLGKNLPPMTRDRTTNDLQCRRDDELCPLYVEIGMACTYRCESDGHEFTLFKGFDLPNNKPCPRIAHRP